MEESAIGAPGELTAADRHYQQFEQFVELLQEKDTLKARLAEVEADLRQREAGLLVIFEMGYDSVRVGGITLSPRREIWARTKAESRKELCAVLKLPQIDLAHYVTETCNMHSVSAHVRGIVANAENAGIKFNTVAELLPPELDAVIYAEFIHKVGHYTVSKKST
jgi:hypothetical protein